MKAVARVVETILATACSPSLRATSSTSVDIAWLPVRGNMPDKLTTYCRAVCVLETLVHVEDSELLPALVMVRYDVAHGVAVETISVADLPASWRLRENLTQQRCNQWHAALRAPLLHAPSAVVPLEDSPDWNVLINHRHPAAAQITIVAADSFTPDMRLY